jgi:hypothetical protein
MILALYLRSPSDNGRRWYASFNGLRENLTRNLRQHTFSKHADGSEKKKAREFASLQVRRRG